MLRFRYNRQSELVHHGVLGMKWGVRRYQDYDGTRIGKARYSTEPDIIKAGSHVYRISTVKIEKDIGQTYIFADQKDADKLAQKLLELNPRNKVFKLTMRVKDTLVGPSEKQRVDNFLKKYEHEFIKEVVDRVKELASQQGINLVDLDGDDTLTSYRAFSIAVAKNFRGVRSLAYTENDVKGGIVRDDYMRGFTQWEPNDKTPIDSLDSAYIVFARSKSLETIKGEEVENMNMKHSEKDNAINSDFDEESLYLSAPNGIKGCDMEEIPKNTGFKTRILQNLVSDKKTKKKR